MASLQSVKHLKALCETEKERLSSFESFLDYLESISCCNDARMSISTLQSLVPEIKKKLENQDRQIDLLEFKEEDTYSLKDIHPYLHADEFLRKVLRVSSFIHNHILIGRDKKFVRETHAIQVLMHECGEKLNVIRSRLRPVYVIGFLAGGMPCHIPSFTDITPIGLPFIDFVSVKTWPIIGHEMSHGHFQHRKERTTEGSYKNEFEADLFSTVILGPAYFLSFLSTYGGIPSMGRQEFQRRENIRLEKTHPTLENRFVFCIDVLERCLKYDSAVIRNLRKNLRPLFHYIGISDAEEDAHQKKISMNVLKGYGVKEDLQAKIRTHGFRINSKKCNMILKKLDSGEPLHKESPREILNAFFSGCYIEGTFDINEKKIDKHIIDSFYQTAKTKINTL